MNIHELHGRRKIFSAVDEITDENIGTVISKAFAIHEENRNEISFLHNYLKGKQPIIERRKDVRPEINNKIVENHALEINNFKVGFIFGEPVQYVKRGNCELDHTDEELPTDNSIAALNEYMQEDGKASKDRELAEWLNQCGIGYKLVLPSEPGSDIPFETYILDPRNTFVVHSNDYKRKPVLGVTYSCFETISKESKSYKSFDVYTDNRYWRIDCISGKYTIVKSGKNSIGFVPIIEYENNPERLGSFETVIGLCEAINLIDSNNLDGIEQVIQAFTWFDNVDIDRNQFKELKDLGAIKTTSTEGRQASIKSIETKLDISQTQIAKDDLYDRMLTIASVPDRRASAGGNTGQALIIGEGWVMAESAAKAFELMFVKSEKQFLKIVLRICKDTINCNHEVKNIKLHDIDIKFTRNKTDNLLTKTQGLMNMLQAGIHPRIAISHCGLFSDPEQVYQDSKPYLEKMNSTGEEVQTVANAIVTDEMLKALDALTDGGSNEI